MNERIRDLALDCAIQLDWDPPSDPKEYTFSPAGVEKFAELIVRECADIAFKNVCYGDGEVGPESDILDHFGIER